MTLQELEPAPQEVKDKIAEVPEKYQIGIGIIDEAFQLATTYSLSTPISADLISHKQQNISCNLVSQSDWKTKYSNTQKNLYFKFILPPLWK